MLMLATMLARIMPRPLLPAWMTGCWEQRSEDRWIEECWTAPRAGSCSARPQRHWRHARQLGSHADRAVETDIRRLSR